MYDLILGIVKRIEANVILRYTRTQIITIIITDVLYIKSTLSKRLLRIRKYTLNKHHPK